MLVECDESLLDSFPHYHQLYQRFQLSSGDGQSYSRQKPRSRGCACMEQSPSKTLLPGQLPWVTVDQESLGSTKSLNHCLSQEIQDCSQRDELARLHDGGQRLSTLGARGNLLSKQISRGQVSVAILCHNLVTLSSLATARSSQNPDNGQPRGGQSRAIHRHLEIWSV